MSELTTPTGDDLVEDNAQPAHVDDVEAEDEGTVAGDSRLSKARREAKNLRDRLKASETALTAAQERLDASARVDVERAAREAGLEDGGDIWRAGVTLADLRDDDGHLDASLLAEKLDAVLTQHPHWRARVRPPASGQPLSYGAVAHRERLKGMTAEELVRNTSSGLSPGRSDPDAPSWSGVFHGR